MTALSRGERRLRRFDPLSWPVALKIAVGLGIALLISGVMTNSLVSQVAEQTQTDLVLTELQSVSRAQAFRVVDGLNQEMANLTRLASSTTVQALLRSLNRQYAQNPAEQDRALVRNALMFQQIQPFKLSNPQLEAVAILDAAGRVVAVDPIVTEVRYPLEAPPGMSRWDWHNSAFNGGRGAVYISGPREDQLTGRRGIHLALPIYDNQAPEEVIGVVYAIWNMENVPGLALVRQRESEVFEADGSVLLSASAPLDSSVPFSLMQEFRQSPSGVFRYSDPEGREWLYSYTNLYDLGVPSEAIANLRWIVTAREPVEVVQSDLAVLTNRLGLAVGVSSALVILVMTGLSFVIMLPLRRLTGAADRIRSGELDAPIPALPQDEIGGLADVLRGLVERLLYRVRQLDSAVRVSRMTARSLDMGQMLSDAANAISESFGHPDVRIYLTDSAGREARLWAAAGDDSVDLPASETHLVINETTLIGRAVLLGELQTAGADDDQPRIALPLRSADRLLGALQISAAPGGRFEQEDLDIFRLVADQLSASIQNARLFEQSLSSLAEIEALNRRLTQQAWEEYLEQDRELRHTLDPDQLWPEWTASAAGSGELSTETYLDASGRSVLSAPLVLRGEPIGRLAVTRPPGTTWSEDERLLVEAVAARLGLIAEGLRLVEETSMRAEREQRISEVSASLQRAMSVDDVLQTALDQLSGALGSDHVSLRIGRPPLDDDRQIEAGRPHAARDGNGASEPGGEGGLSHAE